MSKSFRVILWTAVMLVLTMTSYYSYELGLFNELSYADQSKLSFVNIGVFFAFYLRLGYKLIKDYLKNGDSTESNALSQDELDPGYEAAEYCMGIGMLGTVIGFILMTSSMSEVDFGNIQNVKQMFSVATSGMSTALLTTAVGIVASFSLRLSHYLAGRK